MKNILRNSIITPDGTELISTHRHDFVKYEDANGTSYVVDGGNDYLKRLFDNQDYKETSVYFEDDHEIVRGIFKWGTYGKDGTSPFKRIKLKDLETDHIKNILSTQSSPNHIEEMFLTELEFRS